MKVSRWGGGHEFVHNTNVTGRALEQFMFTNMSPEAEKAIDDRLVTPTTSEVIRLAGITIDDLPPLTIDELIGPTELKEIPRTAQALYFSGPEHPVLVAARKRPLFVTYHDLLRVNGRLGIRQAEVTKNFKGLVRSIFEDPDIPVYGSPSRCDFDGRDGAGDWCLDRFAIRRQMAWRAVAGDYQVGICGTRDANIFNGYGRALVHALYDSSESQRNLELTLELEAVKNLIVPYDDDRSFKWGKPYFNREGLGLRMNSRDHNWHIYGYIVGLLTEIGASSKERMWQRDLAVSEEGFVVAVDALCPLDAAHTNKIKSGHICTRGVHCKGLSQKIVAHAKSIADCIADRSDRPDIAPDDPEDQINMSDPDLDNSSTRTYPARPKADW